MADKGQTTYDLVLDDPAMFLDERGNPRQGRRLVFRGPDGETYEITVDMTRYKNTDAVKAELKALVDAHKAAAGITL